MLSKLNFSLIILIALNGCAKSYVPSKTVTFVYTEDRAIIEKQKQRVSEEERKKQVKNEESEIDWGHIARGTLTAVNKTIKSETVRRKQSAEFQQRLLKEEIEKAKSYSEFVAENQHNQKINSSNYKKSKPLVELPTTLVTSANISTSDKSPKPESIQKIIIGTPYFAAVNQSDLEQSDPKLRSDARVINAEFQQSCNANGAMSFDLPANLNKISTFKDVGNIGKYSVTFRVWPSRNRVYVEVKNNFDYKCSVMSVNLDLVCNDLTKFNSDASIGTLIMPNQTAHNSGNGTEYLCDKFGGINKITINSVKAYRYK
jgi:lipoprotein-anchoring transpeptidase ErfK/SrfK